MSTARDGHRAVSKVLLAGVDGSECSGRALDYAVHWAATGQCEVVVAHVVPWSPFSFATPQENEERHQRRAAELDRAHREIVDPAVDRVCGFGLSARGAVRHGHPAATICQVAEECGASHIFIGKTGTSRIRAQLFGSVAISLVQISTRPVTVVP